MLGILSVHACVEVCLCMFFFLKQKTAYEMRISDWSSDVCSSDLRARHEAAERIGLVIGKRLALGETESLVQRDRGFESPARSAFQAQAPETPFARRVDDTIKHVSGDALPPEGLGAAHRLHLAMLRPQHFERHAPRPLVIPLDPPAGDVPTAEAPVVPGSRLRRSGPRSRAASMR